MSLAFFSLGFRPFFTMTLLLGVGLSLVWTSQYSGWIDINFSPLSERQWHVNEMVFGFLFSAIAGFLLTASSKWTSTRGMHGGILASYFVWFCLVRLIFLFTPFESLLVYQIIGLSVPLVLALFLGTLFLKTKNYRNLIILFPLLVLSICQVLLLAESYFLGYKMAIAAVALLVVIIASRIIPFFTRSALGLDVKFDHFLLDKVLIFSVATLIFEPVLNTYFVSVLFGIAFLLSSIRLLSWRFWESRKVPILCALYVAYLWLPVYFGLSLGGVLSFPQVFIGQSTLHALVFGCMGLMILAMVQRVSLGHTGRKILASQISIVAYWFVGLGAAVRVFLPMIQSQHLIIWMSVSGLLWTLAFLIMAIELIPKLLTPRVDGKPY